VQIATSPHTGPADIPRILGNFRLNQNNIEQRAFVFRRMIFIQGI
jgi:hypothetical protein